MTLVVVEFNGLKPKILATIITGGRDSLASRPTRLIAQQLADSGIADVCWVLREDHALTYERDDFPLVPYTHEFADSYARTHWRHPVKEFVRGGFHGAFVGREFAMRYGAEQGYDLVLQLDDNVKDIAVINSHRPIYQAQATSAEMVGLLAEMMVSTNVAMGGMQLSAVMQPRKMRTVRNGFPYSVFMEKVGPGRLPYYGPFEDDIMHAFEYGLNGGPNRTVGIMEALTYSKDHKSSTGMRKHYDHTRGYYLAKQYPNNAKIRVGARTSSVMETERGVRHVLKTSGFTPIRVTNPDRYRAMDARVRQLVAQANEAYRQNVRIKFRERAERG